MSMIDSSRAMPHLTKKKEKKEEETERKNHNYSLLTRPLAFDSEQRNSTKPKQIEYEQ